MCSRYVYYQVKNGLSGDQIELLPDSSAFNFATGQQALAREKCRTWFSHIAFGAQDCSHSVSVKMFGLDLDSSVAWIVLSPSLEVSNRPRPCLLHGILLHDALHLTGKEAAHSHCRAFCYSSLWK